MISVSASSVCPSIMLSIAISETTESTALDESSRLCFHNMESSHALFRISNILETMLKACAEIWTALAMSPMASMLRTGETLRRGREEIGRLRREQLRVLYTRVETPNWKRWRLCSSSFPHHAVPRGQIHAAVACVHIHVRIGSVQSSSMANSQRYSTLRRPGYPALADFMGQHGGMAMYKQFANLSTHSLLMQQVELLDLQRELELQAELNPGFDEKATTSIH
jgi:hypothetical protein